MSRVHFRHAFARDMLQFFVFFACDNFQRRHDLFQDITAMFEQQSKVFVNVVRHQIHVFALAFARDFNGFARLRKPDDLRQWQDVRATQIEVGVGRRKTISVRAANRHEQQTMRLRLHFRAQHIEYSIFNLMFHGLL